VEGGLARAIARRVGATIMWQRGKESTLLERLTSGNLDLVIAGLSSSSPWKARLGLTRPYYTDTTGHVLAAPPGENAWLVEVETVLRDEQARIPLALRAASP
jgi:ABC-type amino acid transport substrate-binding protein